MGEVYSPRTLAQERQCPEGRVRRLIDSGELRAFRLGGKLLRIRKDAVDALLEKKPTALDPRSAAAPKSRPEPISGTVYFIEASGCVKIGFTTNIASRLETIRTSSPIPPVLVHSHEGTTETERDYHRRFKAYRVHREWFERKGQLDAFLREVAD